MPQFDPGLVRVMRDALEDVMTRVPSEHSTIEVKAYLAEYILKAAARGQTSYDGLVALTDAAVAKCGGIRGRDADSGDCEGSGCPVSRRIRDR